MDLFSYHGYGDIAQPEAPRLLFFDVETPNCRNDRICSIATLTESDEPFSTLVDPEAPFHQVNMSIHGITSEAVYFKPNFRSVWENELRKRFENRILVGYNVTFDLRVLAKTLAAYKLEQPVWRYVDVLPAARRFFDLDYYSLSDVMDELGVSFRHHDAADDVRATKIAFETIVNEEPGLLAEKIYQFNEKRPSVRW